MLDSVEADDPALACLYTARMHPGSAEPYRLLAETLTRHGHEDEAHEMMEQARKLDPLL